MPQVSASCRYIHMMLSIGMTRLDSNWRSWQATRAAWPLENVAWISIAISALLTSSSRYLTNRYDGERCRDPEMR